jgi:uncharacterized protein YndB with AHSA1/START domain
MNTAPTATIRVSHLYEQAPERVFDAWLDPSKAGKFLFATTHGKMVRAEIDPRVGGRFLFVDRRDGVDVEHKGEYLEIDRPRRLAFSFVVSGYEDTPTRVTVAIAPRGTGCELTLTHEDIFPDFAARTKVGWTTILGNLDALLSGALPNE